ncbi:MAG TPA: helix-turn-helix transcriptional regulator, partial [Candidatus Manganitrophaceae bacterium]|nr:helix-turn-helix transcriptional regulator [Candidatus Manganitrophaceae bacterium]
KLSLSRKKGLPRIVHQLHLQFKGLLQANTEPEGSAGASSPTVNRVCIHDGVVYLFRALPLLQQEEHPRVAHILILIEKVSQNVRVDQIAELTKLTQREKGVAQLLLEGKTNKEIAVSMQIGEYTVKDHMKRIMKKLKVSTRAAIVAKILQRSLPSKGPLPKSS